MSETQWVPVTNDALKRSLKFVYHDWGGLNSIEVAPGFAICQEFEVQPVPSPEDMALGRALISVELKKREGRALEKNDPDLLYLETALTAIQAVLSDARIDR